ncbi:MAG: GTP-binding protein [Pseudomonadota bacterium]
MTDQETHYEESLASLRKLARSLDEDTPERKAVEDELDALDEMLGKLESGTVTISVFGEINTGKSSLLNALLGESRFETDVRGGQTVIADREEWHRLRKQMTRGNRPQVFLIDTPGLNEVDGQERADVASETARLADLVLFVVDGDLNQVEMDAIAGLNELNKPIIVCLNKVDLLTRNQRAKTVEAVCERLDGLVPRDSIVLAASDPSPREVVVGTDARGEEIIEERKPKPIIEDVEERVLDILNAEGKAVIALNAMLFARSVSEKLDNRRREVRGEAADTVVRRYMIAKGFAVALNPIVVADFVGGIAVDAAMIRHLGQIYGTELTGEAARGLVFEIGKAYGVLAGAEYATHLLAGVVKTATLGIGTAVTMVPQLVAGAFTTYVVGRAAIIYFSQGSTWGPGGPGQVIKTILADIDRESVMNEIKAGVLDKLKRPR